MKVGDKVRYKLEFCLATNAAWFANSGRIVKLEQNRNFYVAYIIWEHIGNPGTSFTFNLELIS